MTLEEFDEYETNEGKEGLEGKEDDYKDTGKWSGEVDDSEALPVK